MCSGETEGVVQKDHREGRRGSIFHKDHHMIFKRSSGACVCRIKQRRVADGDVILPAFDKDVGETGV